MARAFLEFERPIAELEAKIEELRHLGADAPVNMSEEIERLEKKSEELKRSIFSELTPWQIAQLARHPLRPHTLDYIEHLFTEFDEYCGDRHHGAGVAIVAGTARFNGEPVVVIAIKKAATRSKTLNEILVCQPPTVIAKLFV